MRKLPSLLARYPILSAALIVGAVVLVLSLTGYVEVGRWLAIVTVLVVIVLTAIDMVRDILRGIFGLDILALVAMIATLAVNEYVASLIIVLMLSGGEALEDYAQHRAARELTNLLDRSPQIAHRIVGTMHDGSAEVLDVHVDEVEVGDELLIRPAEVVPVDAKLLTDGGSFDESSLTGESLPVTHQAGEEVFSGAINGERALRVTAVRKSSDSQYQQIVALVKDAHEAQAPVVRLADRYAVPFTAVSLAIAGVAWAVSGDPVRFAEVLVLATPCPLLIAAPVAFLGGLSRCAKTGVVVKGGAVLEQLAQVQSVAFDKTGTLTQGHPELVAVRPAAGFSEQEVLHLVASAEQYSSHVLAEGIRRSAITRGIRLTSASQAEEQATNGVTATIDGRTVVVGKFSFIEAHSPNAETTELESGQLAAYASIDGRFAGAIVLEDEVRPDSASLVNWLHEHGVKRITMLTGDAQSTAESVAAALGITEVHADLRPADKVELLHTLKPRPVLMVGDGVNDAPVLAAADVGIAMGARGSTAAGEAADAVILQDSVAKVADAVAIGKHTLRIALQAIWVGIGLSIALMLIATTGAIPAVVGALMQEVVDLVAILYALRTLTGKLPTLQKKALQRLNSPVS